MVGRANPRPAASTPALLIMSVLLIAACGGGTSASTTEPATAPPAETASTVWTSTLYPYALALPPTWVAHGTVIDEDLFESADGRFRLKVGSGIPEPGQTIADRVRTRSGSWRARPGSQDDALGF